VTTPHCMKSTLDTHTLQTYFATPTSRNQESCRTQNTWQGPVQHWVTHLKARDSSALVHLTSAVVAQSCSVAAVVCPLAVEHTVTPWTNRAQWFGTKRLQATGLGTHCVLSLWHIHFCFWDYHILNLTRSQQMWKLDLRLIVNSYNDSFCLDLMD
jgi:hypothetical protein